MKKTFINLFILSLAATSLAGCDLSSIFGPTTPEEETQEYDDKKVDHLELKDYKTAAIKGSKYEFDGKVFAVYEDKTEQDVTSKATYSTLNTSALTDTAKFKVSYETKEKIYSKTVNIKVVEYISVNKIEISDYSETAEVGVEYDFDGKVTATFIDSTTKDVTEYAVVSPLDVSKKGTSQLVVTYTDDGGQTASAIKPIEVLSLLKTIALTGQTTTYIIGEEFHFDGRVKATYSEGTVLDITDYITVDSSAINTSQVGTYTLKVSYTDSESKTVFEDSVEITVIERIPNLVSISASGYSTEITKKSTYVFDGVVTATFDEGPTADVTKDAVFSSVSTLQTGVKDVTLTYTDPRTNIKRSTTIQIEVVAYISEIRLPETLKVRTGGTAELKPTIVPNDAKNKEVTFVSSNPSVATINQNGLISGIKPGSSVVTVTSKANPEISAQTTILVSDVVYKDWSIFLYVCGSNLETDAAEATYDLYEIDSVYGKPDDVNIVVEAGGSKSWNSYYSSVIDASKLNRFHLTNSSYVQDEQITNANMGKSSTLQSFLEWGIDEYPAEKYALILWNHGGGLAGCCQDENYNDMLTDDEVISAVDGAFRNTGTSKFEWIGYDCCLMQTMEVAEFNSQYFNYQVGSQEVESGYGWKYDGWIGNVYNKKSTETILTSIVDSYINQFSGGEEATDSDSNQTLSYLDLSKISAFKGAWETLATKTKAKITTSNRSNFWNNVVQASHYFGGDISWGAYDAYDYLQKLKANSTFNPGSSYITAVEKALSAMIKHNKAQKGGSADAHGLSCYFYYYYNDAQYSNFTEWISLVNKVFGY